MAVIHQNVDKIIDAANNTIVISEVKSVVDAVNDNTTGLSSKAAVADIYNKAEVDTAVQGVKDDLLNGAGAAYDTLGELATALTDNDSEIAALTTAIAGKADSTHTHSDYALTASLYTKAEVDALIAAAVPFTVDDTNPNRTDIIF